MAKPTQISETVIAALQGQLDRLIKKAERQEKALKKTREDIDNLTTTLSELKGQTVAL